MLMALSDSSQAGVYLGFYVTPSSNTVGIDANGLSNNTLFANKRLDLNRYADKGVAVNDTNWHTFTVTKADNDLRFYLDGVFVDLSLIHICLIAKSFMGISGTKWIVVLSLLTAVILCGVIEFIYQMCIRDRYIICIFLSAAFRSICAPA